MRSFLAPGGANSCSSNDVIIRSSSDIICFLSLKEFLSAIIFFTEKLCWYLIDSVSFYLLLSHDAKHVMHNFDMGPY